MSNSFYKPVIVILLILIKCLPVLAQQTQLIYLSGTDKDHTINWDFYCTAGRNSGKWTQIPVPSHWELQGFGTYNYGHDKNKADEEGLYRHSFTVPASSDKKKVFIVFEGSMTDTEVKINGKLAGPVHQGAFYRFKYDITRLLKPDDKNLLEVKVSKQSANKSVNAAERQSDFWVFGGIFRPVYLEIKPEEYIERTAINAQMDGNFLIDVYTGSLKEAESVEAQIRTLDGKPVGKAFSSAINKKQPKTTLTTRIDNPRLWNPESPYLYQVEVRLKEGGKTLHSVIEKFGFRTAELREKDGFYVNNQKIMFKGVNRHSFWPNSGRTLSKELSIRDVNLMKEMNMNAVRMSHYPPDKHFLEVCDSLGLFVLDELTGWQQAYDTEVGKKLVKELVIRDVNHPSVVIWDNGNEGGNNPDLDDEFAKYDPQKRIVIRPWEIFRGTDTKHYKPYNCCLESQFNGSDVFFPTEFLHGLYDGGHGAGLNDFWNLMLQNPLSAGGFLWVFSDESVVRTDKNNILDSDGNHAPDGIVGPYREKEGSFFAIKEIWSPVYIGQKFITPAFNGNFPIENRYHFTNLKDCTFSWKLVDFPTPDAKVTAYKEVHKGNAAAPDIAPGNKGVLSISLPPNWSRHDALYLTAMDHQGKEIFTWTWPLQSPAAMSADIVPGKDSQKVRVKEERGLVSLAANGVEVKFDKKTGLLSGVRNPLTAISFTNGPVLADLTAQFKEMKHYRDKSAYVVEMLYEGDFKKVKYTMLENGWLKLEYSYSPTKQFDNEPGYFDYLGINFDFPEEKVTGVKYLGRGPYRVWKNRTKGMQFGVWEKTYNQTATGASFQYPEFKGYHSDFYWAVLENKEYPITIVSGTENLFLRLFTPDDPQNVGLGHTKVLFPKGNISFMHAIPPIGTKFRKAETLGNESQKNMYIEPRTHPRDLEGVLYFNFGGGIKE